MDKETIKAFIRWLEEAAEQEILLKREECLKALDKPLPESTRADIRFALRLVEEELLARQEIFRARQQR